MWNALVNVYNSYYDSKIILQHVDNSVAYLFDDEKQIIYMFIIKDGQSYRMEKRITFKDGSISQEESFFLADYHSVKDRIWNLYYHSFSNSSSVKVKMKHHTLAGSGAYQLDLKSNTIDVFKQYLNNDINTVQNLIDYKRYETIVK